MAQSSQPLPLDGARGLNGRIFGDKGNGPDVNKEADEMEREGGREEGLPLLPSHRPTEGQL